MPDATTSLAKDRDFLKLNPSQQAAYLRDTDPEFKAATAEQQAAYLRYITGRGKPAPLPAVESCGSATAKPSAGIPTPKGYNLDPSANIDDSQIDFNYGYTTVGGQEGEDMISIRRSTLAFVDVKQSTGAKDPFQFKTTGQCIEYPPVKP